MFQLQCLGMQCWFKYFSRIHVQRYFFIYEIRSFIESRRAPRDVEETEEPLFIEGEVSKCHLSLVTSHCVVDTFCGGVIWFAGGHSSTKNYLPIKFSWSFSYPDAKRSATLFRSCKKCSATSCANLSSCRILMSMVKRRRWWQEKPLRMTLSSSKIFTRCTRHNCKLAQYFHLQCEVLSTGYCSWPL